MSSSIFDVRKYLENLLTGSPLCEIKNFSKFQEISERLTGFQIINLGSPIRLSWSSDGVGMAFFKCVNRGCSFSPFTSTLSKMTALDTNPLPGLTYFSAFKISAPLEFSWWPNWFEGKARITNFSGNFSRSWFIWVKSLTVVPQRDAVFNTNTTLPL